jgi:hypothetical protein
MKSRHFCPTCHQKLVVEFWEWLRKNIIKKAISDISFQHPEASAIGFTLNSSIRNPQF